MRNSVFATFVIFLMLPLLVGCPPYRSGIEGYPAAANGITAEPVPVQPMLNANPMFVPVTDREYTWNKIVDSVDDYFRIKKESRVREIGNVVTEGQIETFPLGGATLLEPHRGDSVTFNEKLHATLQTIRRQAHVRVIPQDGGYLVEVQVIKEMENLPQPERATTSSATFRYDTSLSRENIHDRKLSLPTFWYPIGRDVALEQEILKKIRECLGSQSPPYFNLPEPVPAVQVP